MKKKKKSEDYILDTQAILFSSLKKNDKITERKIETWDMCRCRKCGKSLSLLEAKFDSNENPIHKVCPL